MSFQNSSSPSRKVSTISFLALALVALFTGTPAKAEVGARVTLTAQSRFAPAQVRIRLGQTVEFKNVSRGTHTVTANPALVRDPKNVRLPQGAQPFHSGRLAPGAVFNHTFTTAGTYQYVCLPHESMGMIGQVVVLP